jgi:hypothetical protein
MPFSPSPARAAQSDLQILFLLRPASVLGLRPFIESSALGFDGARPRVMLAFIYTARC